MPSKSDLIKEVAQEIQWTQKDVQRAIDSYGDVKTKEEIIACCLRYAGPELKRKSYELGSQKRINQQNKNLIKNLTEQLLEVNNFYQNQLVPTLKATIQAQQNNIEDLLKQMPWANKGGK